MATGCGAIVGVEPLVFVASGVVWLVTLGLSRYVSLASIAMARPSKRRRRCWARAHRFRGRLLAPHAPRDRASPLEHRAPRAAPNRRSAGKPRRSTDEANDKSGVSRALVIGTAPGTTLALRLA